jgi:hypothetical protein
MIAETIKILQSGDFYGVSDNIEIAKGKYEYIHSLREGLIKIKRAWLLKGA